MFTARCVPNMYLFGTFSAQNTPEMAPAFPPSRGTIACRAVRGERLPCFAHRGALALAG
jgi:hypothetical protein